MKEFRNAMRQILHHIQSDMALEVAREKISNEEETDYQPDGLTISQLYSSWITCVEVLELCGTGQHIEHRQKVKALIDDLSQVTRERLEDENTITAAIQEDDPDYTPDVEEWQRLTETQAACGTVLRLLKPDEAATVRLH